MWAHWWAFATYIDIYICPSLFPRCPSLLVVTLQGVFLEGAVETLERDRDFLTQADDLFGTPLTLRSVDDSEKQHVVGAHPSSHCRCFHLLTLKLLDVHKAWGVPIVHTNVTDRNKC